MVPRNFPGNVLDAATGVGKVALLIARNFPHSKVWGVDLCEEAIGIAKNNELSNARFLVADSESLPFNRNFFGFVFNRFSFHHFPAPIEALKEFKRVLTEGGSLVVIDPTPATGELNEKVNEVFIEVERGFSGHVKFYSVEEYKEFADKAGLEFSLHSTYPHEIGVLEAHVREFGSLSEELLKRIGFDGNGRKISLNISILVFRKAR